MIRVNLMNQIALETAPVALPVASSKKKWYFYGIAAVLVLAGGVALSLPQLMDLVLPAAAPAPVQADSSKAKDLPQNVAVDKIEEVDFKDQASVASALEAGKISTQSAVLGLSPQQLSQQMWTMLGLVKQNTPSTVRYARVILQAPNYVALQGLVDESKDFQLWQNLLSPKVEAMQADSLKVVQADSKAQIFNLALKFKRPAEVKAVTVSASEVSSEAQKFSQILKSVLAIQDLPKPTGERQMGDLTLHYFEQSVPMADFDRLLQVLEAAKASPSAVGVVGLDLTANHGEGIDAVLRFAVFVRK